MIKAARQQNVRRHRYQIGQQVALSPGFGYARKSGAVYDIVALLPSDTSHFQYRIRSKTEAFERVAAENELVLRASQRDALNEGDGNGQRPAAQQ